MRRYENGSTLATFYAQSDIKFNAVAKANTNKEIKVFSC